MITTTARAVSSWPLLLYLEALLLRKAALALMFTGKLSVEDCIKCYLCLSGNSLRKVAQTPVIIGKLSAEGYTDSCPC